MSKLKTNVLIAATVLMGVVGVNEALEVKTSDDFSRYQREQQVDQANDAIEMENDRRRDRLSDAIDAENSRKLVPAEARPPVPHVKLRLRP